MTARLLQRIGLPLALLVATFSGPAPAARASTICVNHGGTGGCFGTLNGAVAVATNGDTILIASGNAYLERLNINKSLSLVGDSAATTIIDGSAGGQVIRITSAVTVTLTNLTIRNGRAPVPGNVSDNNGGGIHNEKGNLTLNHVIVTGNQTSGGNTCCGGEGGGIYNENGNLTLNNSLVSGNVTGTPDDNLVSHGVGGSGGFGGGIFVLNGALTLNNSAVSGNATGNGSKGGPVGEGGPGGFGGGIYATSATVTLNNSTVSGNITGNGATGGAIEGNGGSGGGIDAELGPLTLNDSTVSGNMTGAGATVTATSGSGAGLHLQGEAVLGGQLVTITTSTISGNATGLRHLSSNGGVGGGIYTTAGITLTVADATLAYNVVDSGQKGGGIANAGGVANVKNSLLAENHNESGLSFLQDCSGAINSLGYNVMMEPDCGIAPITGDQFYVRGQIVNPLANNGGPTQTNALPTGSPAIGKADNSTCSATDQRGFRRPALGGFVVHCDVGAFQSFPLWLPLLVR